MRPPIPLEPDVCLRVTQEPRWIRKIAIAPNGCWLFTGSTSGHGYGQISIHGRVVSTHRVALVAHLGRDLGLGMEADHDCHNKAAAQGLCISPDSDPCDHRRCVNPEHLREKTHRDNTLAGATIYADHASRTHCPAGHPTVGPDALLRPSKLAQGMRSCVVCDREDRDLIRRAHQSLGMSRRAYAALYGLSRAAAKRVLEGMEP